MKKVILFGLWLIFFEVIAFSILIGLTLMISPEWTREAGREIGQKYGMLTLLIPIALTAFLSSTGRLPGFRKPNAN